MANVKVGCKLPHGLTLELGYSIDKDSNVTRVQEYRRYTLNGTNSNLIKGAPASRESTPGITLVDETFMKAWLEKNKGLGFVKAGYVYIIKNDAEGEAIKLDQKKMLTGFEPLDPTKVPKDTKGRPLVEKMVIDEE